MTIDPTAPPADLPIRVVVADDQAVVRRGLRSVLDDAPDVMVVGDAADGQDAFDLCEATGPDVVLMDVHMPRLDGIEATRRIVAGRTGARVLVVTTFDLDAYVFDSLRAGASGFILKDADPADLVGAVRTVHRGESLLSPSATRRLISEFVRERPEPERPSPSPARPSTRDDRIVVELSDRERQIVTLVARGLSNAEIGSTLHLAETTVKSHVSGALAKWGCRDRVQLVVRAFDTGLVPGPS